MLGIREYVRNIGSAASTIFEGMAVTASHLLREPITVQYPDKLPKPITEMMPERFRGLLEVQMDICTGCKRCERACPIEVIAIDLEKREAGGKKETVMSRFDIDMGKCMYCGLCVEACIEESTHALRHTREFELAAPTLDALVLRFVPAGEHQPLYKPPKDKTQIPMGEFGPFAREARERAMRDNAETLIPAREKWFKDQAAAKKKAGGKPVAKAAAPVQGPSPAKVAEIKAKIAAIPAADVAKFANVLEDLTAQTDCGECGYPTCHLYTMAMASGSDGDFSKCAPGGAEATADLGVALKIRRGDKLEPVDLNPKPKAA